MASIEERKRADGTTAYKAEVVIRVNGKPIGRPARINGLGNAQRDPNHTSSRSTTHCAN